MGKVANNLTIQDMNKITLIDIIPITFTNKFYQLSVFECFFGKTFGIMFILIHTKLFISKTQ